MRTEFLVMSLGAILAGVVLLVLTRHHWFQRLISSRPRNDRY